MAVKSAVMIDLPRVAMAERTARVAAEAVRPALLARATDVAYTERTPRIAAAVYRSSAPSVGLPILHATRTPRAAAHVLRAGVAGSLMPTAPPPPPPPPPPTPDTTRPVIGDFSPAPGSPLTKLTPIGFAVTDESGAFRRIFVMAHFPRLGVTEVVHDGDGFRGAYVAASVRTLIAYGFRYSVLRGGGWPDAPTISVHAIDIAGNEDGGGS